MSKLPAPRPMFGEPPRSASPVQSRPGAMKDTKFGLVEDLEDDLPIKPAQPQVRQPLPEPLKQQQSAFTKQPTYGLDADSRAPLTKQPIGSNNYGLDADIKAPSTKQQPPSTGGYGLDAEKPLKSVSAQQQPTGFGLDSEKPASKPSDPQRTKSGGGFGLDAERTPSVTAPQQQGRLPAPKDTSGYGLSAERVPSPTAKPSTQPMPMERGGSGGGYGLDPNPRAGQLPAAGQYQQPPQPQQRPPQNPGYGLDAERFPGAGGAPQPPLLNRGGQMVAPPGPAPYMPGPALQQQPQLQPQQGYGYPAPQLQQPQMMPMQPQSSQGGYGWEAEVRQQQPGPGLLPLQPQQPVSAGGFHPPPLQVPLPPTMSQAFPQGMSPPMTQTMPTQPPPLFTLEQLPPDQRVVHLLPHQANDVIHQLAVQQASMGGPGPLVVDVVDAHKNLANSITPEPMAYVHTVELATAGKRFPLNVKPSLLQTKLKGGQHRLQDLVGPVLEPGQQGFVDLAYTPDGALVEENARVWQFSLALVKAEGVGPTGLRQERSPCLFVARVGLFDRARNRFLGNILGVRPEAVTNKDGTWAFKPHERILVRCNCVQPDPGTGTRLINDDALSLYIELNTSHRLDIADTRHMPPSEVKASKMVDELTTAWAMISFRRCCQVGSADQEVSVPLYYGSLFDPQLLDVLYKAERKKTPLASLLKPKVTPVLVFKAGGLQLNPPPLLPFGFMPSTMVALEDLAMSLAAYRATLALQLARQHSAFAPLSDPVLSSFPGILGDHHLLTEFLVKWKDACIKLSNGTEATCMSPAVAPPIASLIEAFRRCTAEVAPLLRCATLPPKHINNFVEYQGHRLKQVQTFCHVIDPRTNTVVGARHPVEPLSHAGFEYLHAPFDVAECRVSMGDRLEKGAPTFLKYGN